MIHKNCGNWCKNKMKNMNASEKEEYCQKFCCIKNPKNKRFHDDVNELLSSFFGSLEDVWHPFDTNITEGINKFLTKFLPKDRTYCKTIENSVRVHLAIIIDSIGYCRGYSRILKEIGVKQCAIRRYCREHTHCRVNAAEDLAPRWCNRD